LWLNGSWRFVDDVAGRQCDIETIAPIAGLADLDGIFARLALHHVGHGARIAAYHARAKQQQRAGRVRVTGGAHMHIECDRLV
jgi:hypothetical protein